MTNNERKATKPAVAVIGLGTMGRALAATLIDTGHPVFVWNRTLEKADALAAKGATRSASVADAVRASDVVIVCVLDSAAAREVLDSAASVLAGRTIVNVTTGTPAEARELEQWISAQGATYLGGVMMAVADEVGTPSALILYGGSTNAFDTYEPTLRALAGNSAFVGTDPGLPALYDVALLSLLYATITGWLQAFAVVGTAGVSATTFLPYAQAWFTNVVAADDGGAIAAQVDAGKYPDDVGSPVALNAAALDLLVRVHDEVSVDAGVVRAIRALANRRVDDGHAADGLTSLIEAIKRPVAAA